MVGGTDVALSGLLVVQGLATGFRISSFTEFEKYVRDRCDRILEEALRPGGQTAAANLLLSLEAAMSDFFNRANRQIPDSSRQRWTLFIPGNALQNLATICFVMTVGVLIGVGTRRYPSISTEAKLNGCIILLLQAFLYWLMKTQRHTTMNDCKRVVATLRGQSFMTWFSSLIPTSESIGGGASSPEVDIQLKVSAALGQHGWKTTFMKHLSLSDKEGRQSLEVDQMAIRESDLLLVEIKHWNSNPSDHVLQYTFTQIANARRLAKARWVLLVFQASSNVVVEAPFDKPWLKIARIDQLEGVLWDIDLSQVIDG